MGYRFTLTTDVYVSYLCMQPDISVQLLRRMDLWSQIPMVKKKDL